MSRAFVKEESDAPPPPPLERPVSTAPNLVTARGAAMIDSELARLEVEIANIEDEAAVAWLRRDLRYWTTRRASAQLQPVDPDPKVVGFGTRVTLRRDGRTSDIEIVGEDEADPPSGRIAWTSPMAQAIDGAEAGETLLFGDAEIEIVAVRLGGEHR